MALLRAFRAARLYVVILLLLDTLLDGQLRGLPPDMKG